MRKIPGKKLLAALHDISIGTLVAPRFLAQRWESPGRLRMVALNFAFTASVRMVHGIHSHTSNRWLDPAPSRATSFAKRFVFMVQVANLTHGCHALHGKLANFTGRQLHQRGFAFFAQQLR
jgi:hypothetical protein